MRLSEPSTMATDYLLGLVSVYLARKLWQRASTTRDLSVAFWGVTFFSTGLAAFLGGTYHGFQDHLGSAANTFLWTATLLLIGVSSLAMAAGSVVAKASRQLARVVLPLVGIKFVVYAWWVVGRDDFSFAVVDFVSAMVIVLVLHAWSFRVEGPGRGNEWVVAGVAASLFGAYAQQAGLAVPPHLNHNDLFHLIQTVGMLLLFRGTVRLTDRNGPVPSHSPDS